MSQKIFATSSFSSLGCTFLDWTLHYLSGKTEYYNVELDRNVELVDNPLKSFDQTNNKKNAHRHQKNYAGGYEELRAYIEKINTSVEKNNGYSSMHSVYFGPERFPKILKKLNYDIGEITEPHILEHIENFFYEDFSLSTRFLHKHEIPFVYVDNSKYFFFDIRQSEVTPFTGNVPRYPEESFDEYMGTFFAGLKEFDGNENIWDKREFLALNIRPYDTKFKRTFGLSVPYYHIDFRRWWSDPISSVVDIAEFLEIKIDTSRWEKWKDVCLQWKDNHAHYLNFYFSLDHIIDSIMNGWYYKLPSLSLTEEAIIQHMLIYKHNLNLKTWQLKKFPPNTQDLHELLEDNIHKVPKLY